VVGRHGHRRSRGGIPRADGPRERAPQRRRAHGSQALGTLRSAFGATASATAVLPRAWDAARTEGL